ncbi:MAG: glycosyltransferase family 4 protein [Odoribacter sp.]|nr:glycosyltransferase family 4 protein [Odoribacter sp.]
MKTVFEVIGMGAKKYGGFEKYIVEEARQLKDKGYHLVVVFDREPLAVDYIKDLKEIGADVEIVPQSSRLSFIKHFNCILNKYKPEIVHTNFSSNIFLAMPLAMIHGVRRRIATEHCLPSTDRIKLRVAAQLGNIFCHSIIPVSNTSTEAKKKAVWFGRSKIHTLYLGVEDKLYDRQEVRSDLNIADDTVALINIAYHNPIKGVDVLLDAMNIIVNERGIKNLILYQIGGGQTGADTESLHKKAAEYGIEKSIVWMGIRNDVQRLLCAGDIYVQPSRSEGIPLSIMEASIVSLPIVATEVGGNPEAAKDGENAIVVNPENPQALADAIIRLYEDAGLRKRFGNTGRNIALENFCLSRNVTRLIEDYYLL